jgi:trigger factor
MKQCHRYTRCSVKSSVEPLEGNKVKLYVEIDEAEFDRDIDRAFKTIAREIKLPGFRNGKAPRRVLEARIGIAPAREQALRDAIPQYLSKAVREHKVDLIATPEVEITGGEDSGPIEFDATCEVRPEIVVPGYAGLRIELPSPVATDEQIEAAVAEELKRHSSLGDVDRPAAKGDYVTLDLSTTRDGEDVVGLSTEDWSYELGQGWVTEDFDDQIIGSSAGDEVSFTSTPKGIEEAADFVVKIKRVQVLELPEITDEWVADNLGEFESVEEWKADIADRLGANNLNSVRNQLVPKLTEALAQLVEEEPPPTMVGQDLQTRIQRTAEQLQAQGIDLETWMSVTGQSSEDFVQGLQAQSEQAVKVDLALRAVATAEALVVSDDELEDEYLRMAMQFGQTAKAVRKAYEDNDAVTELTAQLLKSKALDWLLHRVEMVDPEGNALDTNFILGHDEHDHDHAHDHGDDGDHEDHNENGDEE